MKLYDFLEIDDDKIPELFRKGIKDLDVDELDLNILEAFYFLKRNNPNSSQILFSYIAHYLTDTVSVKDNNFIFWYFYNQIERRASRLTDLPLIWDLNDEIDAIIEKGEDLNTINSLKQYRNDCGSGLLKCNFIHASIGSILNSDGSILSFFLAPSNSFDNLFFKALNIQ